jgi:YidC/Oxa1 family membrane protein insertase
MSSEKRLIVFTIVTFLSILTIQYVMEATGLVQQPPPKKPGAAVAKVEPKDKDKDKDQAKVKDLDLDPAKAEPKDKAKVAKAAEPETPKGPIVPVAEPAELVLGSTAKKGPYRLEVQLDQKGAGVASVGSAIYEAEFVEGKPKHQPLQLLRRDPLAAPSLALTLVRPRTAELAADAEAAGVIDPGLGELALDGLLWEVVRGPDGKIVQAAAKKGKTPGQSASFRTKVDSLGLTLTKTYTLFEGDDGFSMDLKIESPDKDQPVVYKLLGPHGVPIEGEWYTGVFRDAVFGMIKGTSVETSTLTADSVAKRKDDPERFVGVPFKYLGVENQYFAVLLLPTPPATGLADNPDDEARPLIYHLDPEARQKADIGVEVKSRSAKVGPNAPLTRSYRVFAGPKTLEALEPFGAQDVAFRKSSWIPGAVELARWVITPLLGWTYSLTQKVGALFGKGGNYGVAIILLTLLVRMAMFPLGRKAALAAKKMQDLQPLMMEIKEKYKDDKEEQGRQTMALYRRQGVNPVGGCLPALVQLPIFVGLWQALNNSVNLRHATFLWIDNLAAPDMLFKFPTEVPFLGQYFNLLPFGVVALMLVQTKLFSPPATTPEAEAQQKMMKYMMVFMAFMFYKVPSGLGIYFITSSTWQICERLLLPKVSTAPKGTLEDEIAGSASKPAKPPGKIAEFFNRMLDEAKKDPTYRKIADESTRNGNSNNDRDRGRDKGKPRPKPGKKR